MNFVMPKQKKAPNIFADMDFRIIGRGWLVFRLCGRDIQNWHEVFYMLQQ